ncbi:hypothetical protein [Methanoplanus limicola]|uniref:Uncharacterized protein n=1 Tax=Methanoplanus limicola DSM 2279 TaxID=937775 RepID=H1Z2F2_9EURY|nr:hypothetical protein [Methanoplanus limicola]EHQ35478.1 hypothetical protein Metlim_1369 [Methanoplanus limicola DSM 2279]
MSEIQVYAGGILASVGIILLGVILGMEIISFKTGIIYTLMPVFALLVVLGVLLMLLGSKEPECSSEN